MSIVYDREVKECIRLAESAVEHLRKQNGHSRYAVSLLNKIMAEMMAVEEAMKEEGYEND